MPTDDLVRLVAFNALCTGIPADHISSWVERQQCVVLYRVNEETESLLAGAQGTFNLLARGDVHRDAKETRYCAIGFIRGGHHQSDRQRFAVFPDVGPF